MLRWARLKHTAVGAALQRCSMLQGSKLQHHSKNLANAVSHNAVLPSQLSYLAAYCHVLLLQDKKYLKAYLGSDGKDIAWDFIRAAMASVSNTSIIMMQVCAPTYFCVGPALLIAELQLCCSHPSSACGAKCTCSSPTAYPPPRIQLSSMT